MPDIVPLRYWLATRIRDAAGLYSYAALSFGFPLWAFLNSGPVTPMRLGCFMALWMAYSCIYEIGYFANDFWSQRREVEAGIAVRKPRPTAPSRHVVLLATATRVLVFSVIVATVGAVVAGTASHMMGLAAVMTVVFCLHNAILGPVRVLTFLALQLARYGIVVALSPGPWTVRLTLVIGLPQVLAYTLRYATGKQWPRRRTCLQVRSVQGVCRVMSGAYLMLAIACSCLKAHWWSVLCLRSALLSVSIAAVFVLGRAVQRLLSSFKTAGVRYHVHSEVSHDGRWSIEEIALAARQDGIDTVYITEHAEDLRTADFVSLSKRCDSASQNRDCRLIAGLEYSFFGQHILAIGLRTHDDRLGTDMPALAEVRSYCQALIWAHPAVSIRRLVRDPLYGIDLVRLCLAVDGVEWLNLKPERTLRSQWRFMPIFFAAMAAGASVEAFVGLDAHSEEGWNRSNARLEAIADSTRFFERFLRFGVAGRTREAVDSKVVEGA
jgi:predicted metal-dependent phosphoesterase TrpH